MGGRKADLALIEQRRAETVAVALRLLEQFAATCSIAGLPAASRPSCREGGGASPGDSRRAARSSTWRETRAPIRGASPRQPERKESHAVLPMRRNLSELFPSRQLLSGYVGLDPLRFGGVEVQLDLDAVGVVHEQLVERLAVRAALFEFDLVAPQVRHGLLQAFARNATWSSAPVPAPAYLREAPEVGLLGSRPRASRSCRYGPRPTPAKVHPVDGKTEVRMPALLHAEHVAYQSRVASISSERTR